jgi:hypothetical protein
LGQAILRKFIRPKAQSLGIEKRFGWHTFRHTYSTLLRSVGTEFKVMQDLLRHSTLRSMLDVYTQAITASKRAAQDAVMLLVLGDDVAGTDTERQESCFSFWTERLSQDSERGTQKGHKSVSFCTHRGFH